jgi:type VI secretion system protein ImpJ
MRLVPEKELGNTWIGLPLARVTAIHADGSIELDDGLIPAVSRYGASPLIVRWLMQVYELVHLRAQALSERLVGNTYDETGGASTITDLLLLQILNGYEPILRHMSKQQSTPPVELYQLFLSLAGELSTHLRPATRRPLMYPNYDHMALHKCLWPLVEDVRALLNAVLVRSAQRLDLHHEEAGYYASSTNPADLRRFTSIVLAVQAALPPDILAHQFLMQTKVAPPDKLPGLVQSHLPSLELRPMPVPPRQIPFNAGYVYYELSSSGPLWDEIVTHGGIAMHVAGEFPSLSMELWGIRA